MGMENNKFLRLRFKKNFYSIRNRVMFDKSISTSAGVNKLILGIITNDLIPKISEVIKSNDLESDGNSLVDIRLFLTEEERKSFDYLYDELFLTDKSIFVIGIILALFKDK